MIVLGLIIAVIVLAIKNSELNKKVNEYKNLLIKYGIIREYIPPNNTMQNLYSPVYQQNQAPLVNQNNMVRQPVNNNMVNQKVIKEKPKYTEQEIKNSSILIVGSILVVLSALIFLTTTWDVTNNFLKTLMLFVMLFVFYGASYIAKKIKLNQTYKAFHYITLAYIPITLLSLCVFKLIGSYFSIGGEGLYIYLSLCSFVVCGIYYMDAKNKNSKFVGIMSLVFLLLGILFLDIKYADNFETYICSFLCLGVLFTILHNAKKYYISEDINKISIYIIVLGIFTISVLGGLIAFVFNYINLLYFINSLLLFYLIYYALLCNNNMKFFNGAYPLLLINSALIFSGFFEDVFVREIIILIVSVLICAYELYKNNKVSDAAYYEILGCSFILYLCSYINNSIPPYLVIFTFLGISLMFYLGDEVRKTYKLYFVSTLAYLLIVHFFSYYDMSILYTGYAVLIMIGVSMFREDDISKSIRYVGYAFMLMLSACFDYSNILSVLILVIYTIITFVYSVKRKDMFNRILSYIYLNLTGFALGNYLVFEKISDYFLMIPVCNIIIFMSEILLRNKNINIDKVILYVHYGLSALILIILNSEMVHLSLIIATTAMFCLYCNSINEDKGYKYVPYIIAIPFIYGGKMLMLNDYNCMQIVSYLAMFSFLIITYKNHDDKHTIFYYVYLFFHIFAFEDNKYLMLLLFALCSGINYLFREGKIKDLFKVFLYTSAVILIEFVVYDLDVEDIAIFTYGVYMIYAVFLTRSIFKKYTNNYKIIEYISLVLINFAAIETFTSETDGLIFVIFLVFGVIISYVFKYGPVFLTSLIFIIINTVILTKEFWLSLPWWLYILLIGSILIIFAVGNELRDKKNSGKIVEKIKDDLDL